MPLDYTFWRNALAGKEQPIHDGCPNAGFYRLRSKNKQTNATTWRPIAYFEQDGELRCMVGGEVVTKERGEELWSYVCRSPVSEEAYRRVIDGGLWDDQDQIVAEQTRGFGDNSGSVDEFDALNDQITAAAAAGKSRYTKIASKEQSEQAQSLRSRLLELSGQAEKSRKRIADPLHKQWKEINDKWKPIIDTANTAAAIIKRANDDYLTGQLQAKRKVEQEAADEGLMAPAQEVVVPERVKGAYGRAASAKPEWALVKIVDYDAALTHFKNTAAVREAVEDLARKAIKSGEIVPGCEREERMVTR